MRVIINEGEILTAIEDYILGAVNVPDDIRIDIDLKATRGEGGYTAEIDLVHMSSPADGSDRSVDDRITAKDDAREEGLGIVEKIDAARTEAKAPRRRGRPAGSKNINKEPETTVEGATHAPTISEAAKDAAISQVMTDQPEPEAAVEIQEEAAEELNEPMADEASEEVTEDLPAEAPTAAPEPKRSLFGGLSATKTDDVPAEDPAPETAQPETETEAEEEQVEDPEPNSEAALAAEAAATEPTEANDDEDVDYTPTPETKGFESDDAAPSPAPRRSLFADLTKPTN